MALVDTDPFQGLLCPRMTRGNDCRLLPTDTSIFPTSTPIVVIIPSITPSTMTYISLMMYSSENKGWVHGNPWIDEIHFTSQEAWPILIKDNSERLTGASAPIFIPVTSGI